MGVIGASLILHSWLPGEGVHLSLMPVAAYRPAGLGVLAQASVVPRFTKTPSVFTNAMGSTILLTRQLHVIFRSIKTGVAKPFSIRSVHLP